MIDHDRLFKELLSTFFAEFIELFFPELFEHLDPNSIVFLDKEIFTDVTAGKKHEADLIAKVKLRNEESYILVHTEPQSRSEPVFPYRMFSYFARLHEHHRLPIYPVALFSFNRPKSLEPSEYTMTLPGLNVLNFQYSVIQLNKLNWRTYLSQQNPVAAALMSKMQVAPKERIRVKLECLRMIANLKLDAARSRLLSGFVDSYLKLSKTETIELKTAIQSIAPPQRKVVMEIMTSWEKDGMKKGLQQGASSIITKQISMKFGSVDKAILKTVKSLSYELSNKLAGDLLDFRTIKDLEDWLSEHEH